MSSAKAALESDTQVSFCYAVNCYAIAFALICRYGIYLFFGGCYIQTFSCCDSGTF